MNAAFIVDCSLAMTWVFNDEATPATTSLLRRLATEAMLVPAHWFLEVANVLVVAERKGRITVAQSAQFLGLLSTLNVQVDDLVSPRAFDHVLPLARAHLLSSYDAAYLDLALRTQLPLASLDEPLCQAAAKLGVILLGK
jgi:predicted nucleic acid-binding protein